MFYITELIRGRQSETAVFSAKEPLEVKMLEDYITNWEKMDGEIIFFPKKHLHFDKLFLRSRYAFMDRVFDFSGVIELVPEQRMNEDSKHLHNSLMELSCDLSGTGFFKRKPRFESYALLNLLQDYIPSLGVNNGLVNALNESRSVIALLRQIRPDDLCITLSSFAQGPRHLVQQGFDPIGLMVENYRNPNEVTWIVSLSKLISRTLSYRKMFTGIVSVIDCISEIVLRVSRGVQDIT